MIDLHVHSTFSDGSETPMALAVAAASSGLTAMALTDHDTMRGVNPFLEACSAHGLRGIAGVEVSAEYSHGTMHILGYLVQPGNVELENALESMRAGRGDRNQVILEKLNALGLVMTWDEVAAKAGEDVVGRPHFAMVMLDKGYVKTKEEAFDRYLAKGKVAYVSPTLASDSRTLKVRFDFPNPDLKLKPQMYADVTLTLAQAEGVTIPDSALIDTGLRQVVFVETAPGSFEPRAVRVGVRGGGQAQILAGVNEGEKVVIKANFLLDSESRLRAALNKVIKGSGQ